VPNRGDKLFSSAPTTACPRSQIVIAKEVNLGCTSLETVRINAVSVESKRLALIVRIIGVAQGQLVLFDDESRSAVELVKGRLSGLRSTEIVARNRGFKNFVGIPQFCQGGFDQCVPIGRRDILIRTSLSEAVTTRTRWRLRSAAIPYSA